MIKEVKLNILSTSNASRVIRSDGLGIFWRTTTCFFAFVYILTFHYSYVNYINPTFEYAHYIYLSFSNTALISTYLLSLLPVITYRPSSEPAQALTALIYAFLYIPIQLSLLFTVEIDYQELLKAQLMLAISMMVFFYIAKDKKRLQPLVDVQFKNMDRFVFLVTAISLGLLIKANIDHMRFVPFEDVYDLRFAAAKVSKSKIHDYLSSWTLYCFTSYFYARGLVYRKWGMLLFGIVCGILMFMATGAKTSILLLPISLGMAWLWSSGRNFLPKLLIVLSLSLLIIIFAIPDSGIAMWIKSIILVRVLGSDGWVTCKYYEFFTTQGLTYYSHISPINALTDIYPYGDLSLGQVIGLAYSGSTDANFNANFWASDGFAALGSAGVILITPFVALLLKAINRLMSVFDSKFYFIWMLGFFIALLNLPLTTAFLSGGCMVIFSQAWWLLKRGRSRNSSLEIA
jgi:hypothetical protein